MSGNSWEIQKINGDVNGIVEPVTNELNNLKTPVGYSRFNNANYITYINSDPFNISEWNLNWYEDVTELQNGINTMTNQGWVPVGLSLTNENLFYVFYIKSDLQATAWQITESQPDLQQVARDVEQYTSQGYVPMGISVYSGFYYTLLVKFPDGEEAKWSIEGYQDNKTEIQKWN